MIRRKEADNRLLNSRLGRQVTPAFRYLRWIAIGCELETWRQLKGVRSAAIIERLISAHLTAKNQFTKFLYRLLKEGEW